MDEMFECFDLGRVAVKDSIGNSKTYHQLYMESQNWASHLGKRNIVCILCDKSIETVSFLFEMLISGQVPMLLPSDIYEGYLQRLVDRYQVQYIWCSNQKTYSGEIYKKVHGHTLYRVREQSYEVYPDLALLLSTSGSTGSPKMVRLSYDNLRYNFEFSSKRYRIFHEHIGISILPLHHIWGLQFCFWHWYVGAEILLTEDTVMSKDFMELYTREKVNNIAGVPAQFQMMGKINFWNEEKLRTLHAAMSAGSRLRKEDQDRLGNLLKGKFWSCYGQTESTGIVISCSFKEGIQRQGVIGTPLEGTAAYQSENELVIQGRSVCLGYARGYADLRKGDENLGLLYTGDIVSRDKNGFFSIEGRNSRFIKVLGERISLDEIEMVLEQQNNNCEFVCIGDTDLLDIYYTGRTHCGTEKECLHILSALLHIPPYMVRFHQLENFPRSESGKILYGKL